MEGVLDLVRDIEDEAVLDRHGREIGRVDRVILEIRPDGARVIALEVGPAVLATRVSSLLGRCMAGLEHALGIDEGRPLRISIPELIDFDPHIRIDRDFSETPAGAVERRLRRWLPRLP